jgi:hypothetical protein
MSAVIGAIWLDLEKQKKDSATVRTQVFKILRRIDTIVAGTTQIDFSEASETTILQVEMDTGSQCITNKEISDLLFSDVTIDPSMIAMDTEPPPSHYINLEADPVVLSQTTSTFLLSKWYPILTIPKPTCRAITC